MPTGIGMFVQRQHPGYTPVHTNPRWWECCGRPWRRNRLGLAPKNGKREFCLVPFRHARLSCISWICRYGIQLLPFTPAAGLRDEPDWVAEMLPEFNASCSADPVCAADGWSILMYRLLPERTPGLNFTSLGCDSVICHWQPWAIGKLPMSTS